MTVNRFLTVTVSNCTFTCILVLTLIVGNILPSLHSAAAFEGIHESGRILHGHQEHANSLCTLHTGILITFTKYFLLYFSINMIVILNSIETDSAEIYTVQF